MSVIERLAAKWKSVSYPFLIHGQTELFFSDIYRQETADLSEIKSGDVVALIGDFTPVTIATLLQLIDRQVIIVPLTAATRKDHDYFFQSACVSIVIEGREIFRPKNLSFDSDAVSLVEDLRQKQHAGLVLFSTGTTGRPKAILHDFTQFLDRFETPRPTLRTLNFLLFDHIGGLNTLFHTLFNLGCVIAPLSRDVDDILEMCRLHRVEVLPATPTFLRMMLMSGLIPHQVPDSLRIITYGTERMDQPTLDELCHLLPDIDFRQTFGMSELGIVRVKSKSRNSLFMKIGGEGVETRIRNSILEIRSKTRMLGYLNAPSPFDEQGWYNTKDIVEEENGYIRVVGRTSEVINVGGLKFMASEVERVALDFSGVALAKAEAKDNPITGQHVELFIEMQPGAEIDKAELKHYLAQNLQPHMMPKRLKFGQIAVGHRFKRQ